MSKNESKKKDKKQKKENKEEVKMPEEFEKIVRDLTEDIKITFPEYIQIIEKWWKPTSYFNSIEDVEERKKQRSLIYQKIKKSSKKSMRIYLKFGLGLLRKKIHYLITRNGQTNLINVIF